MEDSPANSFNKTHLQDPNPSSSPCSSIPTKPSKSKFHYFFSKSLILILVLLILSLFPSQVPEFFKKTTIINKIWDLIYLLVIGIAVCYGLFSRKMDRVYSTSDENMGPKESYLSGISHISSIFENGVQNSYGFDEKDLFERSGFGKSNGKKLNLNQYFLGESLVVINDEKYVLEQLGKPKTMEQNRVSKDFDFDSGNGKSVVKDCLNDGNGMKGRKFRGLVPIKLEERFKETDSNSESNPRIPLNWRSKSMRLEKNEANESSQDTPRSVPVPDFESVRSKSMRFSLLDLKNSLEKEEPKGMETDRYHQNGKTSFKDREFSMGSSSKTNNQSSSKESPKDFNGINIEDDSNHGTRKETMKDSETNLDTSEPVLGKSDSSNSILKPVYKRGKSVRTNRAKEQVVEVKVKTDDKVKTVSKPANRDEARIVDDELSDTEPHSGEVDRKADEFIAKFREQIRLQQVASARRLNLR